MKTSVGQISFYIVSWYYLASLKKKKKIGELPVAMNLKKWY